MTLRRSLLILALLLTSPLSAQDLSDVSLPDPQQEAEALALMDSIRCVVCQGQPISGSNAGLAGDMRREIRERIAAGQSADEVRDWLVSRYGEWVTFEPVANSRNAPLWLVPLLAMLAGIWLISHRLRSNRRKTT
jgi:cytochrome c-type biogenesis protein CcmH